MPATQNQRTHPTSVHITRYAATRRTSHTPCHTRWHTRTAKDARAAKRALRVLCAARYVVIYEQRSVTTIHSIRHKSTAPTRAINQHAVHNAGRHTAPLCAIAGTLPNGASTVPRARYARRANAAAMREDPAQHSNKRKQQHMEEEQVGGRGWVGWGRVVVFRFSARLPSFPSAFSPSAPCAMPLRGVAAVAICRHAAPTASHAFYGVTSTRQRRRC